MRMQSKLMVVIWCNSFITCLWMFFRKSIDGSVGSIGGEISNEATCQPWLWTPWGQMTPRNVLVSAWTWLEPKSAKFNSYFGHLFSQTSSRMQQWKLKLHWQVMALGSKMAGRIGKAKLAMDWWRNHRTWKRRYAPGNGKSPWWCSFLSTSSKMSGFARSTGDPRLFNQK